MTGAKTMVVASETRPGVWMPVHVAVPDAQRTCVETDCDVRMSTRARLCDAHRISRARARRESKSYPSQAPGYQLPKRAERFGITVDDVRRMREQQGGVCASCGKIDPVEGRDLAIDHDHATGQVRGLLCGPCNLTIGSSGDDILRLLGAALYLMDRS